jgi:hypothetical protein
MIINELWVKIKDWEDRYEISSIGRVRSIERIRLDGRNSGKIRIMKSKILRKNMARGYETVLLYKNNEYRLRIGVHRLMAIGFIQNPENKETVNHINGIKHDNRLENLEWATHSENQLHAVKHNLRTKTLGSNSNFAKLSEEEVLDIRALYESGHFIQKELGKIYNIGQSNIEAIVNRKCWKHI